MFHLSKEDKRVWLVIGAVSVLTVLFIPFSQLVLGVNYTYTVQTVALGGAILGLVSGVLGSFAVLRRESLMGDALSHAALPGVGIAFLLAGRELSALLIGAGVSSWIGVQFIRSLLSTTRIKQDTAMGIVLAAWFAAGIALLTYIQAMPNASQAGLATFIFGQAAAIVSKDVILITGVGIVTFLMVGLFWKEFKLVTFDPEFAGANGFRTGFINTLLSTLIVIAIVLGLQLAGVILMVGMLIAPGIAARQWTYKLDQMIILSGLFGIFAGGTGAVISAIDSNIPTGPMIIVSAFLVVMVSIGFAPERGLVWAVLRRRGDKRRFAAQTTLRDLYKYAISHGTAAYPVPEAFIKGIDGARAELGLTQLAKRHYIEKKEAAWVLTSLGAEVATKDAYNQQLWDMYREYSDELKLPVVMEDRQKNISDVLPEAAIAKLEHKLKGMVA